MDRVARLRALTDEAARVQASLNPSPAPWSVQDVGWNRTIRAADGSFVASVGSIVNDHDGLPSRRPIWPDAAIIAAAPEMAALLREAIARLKRVTDELQGYQQRYGYTAIGAMAEEDALDIISRARPILSAIDGGQP